MFNIQELFPAHPPQLFVVDVGAASMGEGTDPYHQLAALPSTHVIGFEPNPHACAERNRDAPANHKFLPYFVGDGTERRFYICDNPLTSSLYEPNHELLDRFQRLHLPVVGSEMVKTQRLDDIDGINGCDYLKLDIQGAELDAIMGGDRLLEGALVVHTEIEFIPMYKDQPLFGDIDVALRQRGFMLHKFQGLFSRQMKPFVLNNDPFSPFSQLVYAEAAVYVRNFMEFDALPTDKLLNLASILHISYGSFDLCAQALAAYDRKRSTNVYEAYLARITGQTV